MSIVLAPQQTKYRYSYSSGACNVAAWTDDEWWYANGPNPGDLIQLYRSINRGATWTLIGTVGIAMNSDEPRNLAIVCLPDGRLFIEGYYSHTLGSRVLVSVVLAGDRLSIASTTNNKSGGARWYTANDGRRLRIVPKPGGTGFFAWIPGAEILNSYNLARVDLGTVGNTPVLDFFTDLDRYDGITTYREQTGASALKMDVNDPFAFAGADENCYSIFRNYDNGRIQANVHTPAGGSAPLAAPYLTPSAVTGLWRSDMVWDPFRNLFVLIVRRNSTLEAWTWDGDYTTPGPFTQLQSIPIALSYNTTSQEWPSIRIDPSGTIHIVMQNLATSPVSFNYWTLGTDNALAHVSTHDIAANFYGLSLDQRIGGLIVGHVGSGLDPNVYLSPFYISLNAAPNAPSLVSPIASQTIAVDQSNIFDWDFSDPDAGDTQSRHVGEIRVSGGAVVHSWDVETISTQYTLVADTLAAGGYEWRVKTYDAQGVEGPWSSWEPFTGAATPGAPTITSHASSQVITSENEEVTWSTSEQRAYQGQRVADNAGVIDTGTIYWDSGMVESVSTRSRVVNFPDNAQFEWIRWRIRRNGLWSPWAEVRVEVSYTPPPIPTLVITESDVNASITLDVTNPAPGVGEPLIESNEVYKRQSALFAWERVAVEIAPDGSFVDYAIASGQSYQYYVKAIADNGTTAISATGTSPGVIFKGSRVHLVSNPSGGYRFRYNGEGGESNWEPEVTTQHYAGRTLPVAEFGEFEEENVSVSLALDGDAEVAALRELVKAKEIMCYRDGFGRLLFCIVSNLNLKPRFFGAESSAFFQGVDYSEEV